MIRRGIATGWAMLAILIIVMPISDVDATDSGVSLLNYSESRGCEPYDRGFARPYVTRAGPLTASDQIRGPWGDMFGRSYYQVRDSLVNWQLPGSNKVLRVHQRMLPALERAGGDLDAAARRLGIDRTTLEEKLSRLGILLPDEGKDDRR